MTQTPETKTPTRAEALRRFDDIIKHADHDTNGVTIGNINRAFLRHCDIQEIRAALATDAPIVEGLDEALQMVKANFQIRDKIPMSQIGDNLAAIEKVERAAKAYAQGRIQMEPEEQEIQSANILKAMMEKIGHGQSLVITRVYEYWRTQFGDNGKHTVKERYNLLEAISDQLDEREIQSAAPPVTGGAWIKVDPDNIYQGYFAWLDEDSDDQEPMVCAWPPMEKYAKCFKRGYYCPLPTPPSSQTRGG